MFYLLHTTRDCCFCALSVCVFAFFTYLKILRLLMFCVSYFLGIISSRFRNTLEQIKEKWIHIYNEEHCSHFCCRSSSQHCARDICGSSLICKHKYTHTHAHFVSRCVSFGVDMVFNMHCGNACTILYGNTQFVFITMPPREKQVQSNTLLCEHFYRIL